MNNYCLYEINLDEFQTVEASRIIAGGMKGVHTNQ